MQDRHSVDDLGKKMLENLAKASLRKRIGEAPKFLDEEQLEAIKAGKGPIKVLGRARVLRKTSTYYGEKQQVATKVIRFQDGSHMKDGSKFEHQRDDLVYVVGYARRGTVSETAYENVPGLFYYPAFNSTGSDRESGQYSDLRFIHGNDILEFESLD